MTKENKFNDISYNLFLGIIRPSSYIFLPMALLWLIVKTPRETMMDQFVFVTIILYFIWMAMRGVLYGYFMQKAYRTSKARHNRYHNNED